MDRSVMLHHTGWNRLSNLSPVHLIRCGSFTSSRDLEPDMSWYLHSLYASKQERLCGLMDPSLVGVGLTSESQGMTISTWLMNKK